MARKARISGVILLVALLSGTPAIVDTAPADAKKVRLHEPILIDGDEDFRHLRGVRGKGTLLRPYVIDDLAINASLPFCFQCRGAGIEIRNTNSYFVVRNVDIRSGALALYGNAGVKLLNVSNGRIEFSSFRGNAVGILGINTRNMAIDQNTFLENDWGIAFSQSDEITISRNQISLSGRDGISIGEVKSGKVRVLENVVSGSEVSGIMTFATLTEVSGNMVYDNDWFGIYDLSENSVISSNNADSNGRVGIQVASGNSTLMNNNIATNDLGVRIWSYGTTILTGNKISGNQVGVESAFSLDGPGEGFVFHNSFLQNGINARPGPRVEWDAGYPTGGNYWSDYTGTDQCSAPAQDVCTGPDGLGDTPYFSEGIEMDQYPLMQPLV